MKISEMRPVLHRSGCGWLGAYTMRPVEDGDILTGELVRHLDGRPFQGDDGTGDTGELLVCDVCGQEFADDDWPRG